MYLLDLLDLDTVLKEFKKYLKSTTYTYYFACMTSGIDKLEVWRHSKR